MVFDTSRQEPLDPLGGCPFRAAVFSTADKDRLYGLGQFACTLAPGHPGRHRLQEPVVLRDPPPTAGQKPVDPADGCCPFQAVVYSAADTESRHPLSAFACVARAGHTPHSPHRLPYPVTVDPDPPPERPR
jgi:hypothetical protein